MAQIRAVVFDLDDTLFPERSYALSGLHAVAVAFGEALGDPEVAAAEMCALFDGADRRRVFNVILQRRDLTDDPETVARMIAVYRAHAPSLSFHEDAEAVLVRLRSKFRLGLITDGPSIMQVAKVMALHIRELVDEVILTDELGVGFGKPHPMAFELIAKRLGVVPESCVYVADNAGKDFVAPNALGWMSVKIERQDGLYREVQPVNGGVPQETVASLDQLDALVK